jgi:hypothetical protein
MDEIEKYLYNWWIDNIDNKWAYHGSSVVYEEYFLRNGFNPKERPFSLRLQIFFRIVQKVRQVEGVLSSYLSWNLKDSSPDVVLGLLDTSFWTTNWLVIKMDYGGGAKKGGEFMKGVKETAESILEKYPTSEKMREVISERELRYVHLFLVWAKNIINRSDALVLAVRLSNKAFNRSNISGGKHVPGGPIKLFIKRLKYFFKIKKLNWDLETVRNYLKDELQISDQITTKIKIRAKDIHFVDFD